MKFVYLYVWITTITSQCQSTFYRTPCVFQQSTNYEANVSSWHPIVQGEKRSFKLLCGSFTS